jgi:hypothetical protein
MLIPFFPLLLILVRLSFLVRLSLSMVRSFQHRFFVRPFPSEASFDWLTVSPSSPPPPLPCSPFSLHRLHPLPPSTLEHLRRKSERLLLFGKSYHSRTLLRSTPSVWACCAMRHGKLNRICVQLGSIIFVNFILDALILSPIGIHGSQVLLYEASRKHHPLAYHTLFLSPR